MLPLLPKLGAHTAENCCKCTRKGLRVETNNLMLVAGLCHIWILWCIILQCADFIKEGFGEKSQGCSFQISLINSCRSYRFISDMGDISHENILNKPFQIQAIMRKSFCFGPVNFLFWNRTEYINLGLGRGKTSSTEQRWRFHISSSKCP